MRNHERIVSMRQGGIKPSMVWVQLDACPRGNGWRSAVACGDAVYVEPGDRIKSLDLRFIVGCLVHVSGSDAVRVREAFEAMRDNGASRVIASCGRVVRGKGEIDFTMDTAEVMTWRT